MARHFFPLSGERNDNYVAGLSMGGYGAFKLALTCPERFAAAASLSGTLDVTRLAGDAQVASHEEMRHIFGEVKSLAGSRNDLFHLAKEMIEQGKEQPRLYQWCGTGDFLYADNVRFRDHVASLGLAMTSEEGPGGHEWRHWDVQIQHVLAWLPGMTRQ